MTDRLTVKEVIIVEGRYDINAIKQAVDAYVFPTDGFGIFSDKEKLALLRRLAIERGVVILTDSDGAGFVIRSFLKGGLPKDRVKQAYIPDIYGKESRKVRPSAEGKLGVEAMNREVIIEVLRRAGASFEGEETRVREGKLTKADLYELGLSGGKRSASKRAALLKKFDLPEHLAANAMLDVLNIITDAEEVRRAVEN